MDIAAGSGKNVWILGCQTGPGGYFIYRYNADTDTFVKSTGNGVAIEVSPNGQPWVAINRGEVYKLLENGKW